MNPEAGTTYEDYLQAVRTQQERDRDRFTGSGLDFNSRTGQYLLSGRVHGVLQPRTP